MPSSSPKSVVCPHCQHHHYCIGEDTNNDTEAVVQRATITQNRRPPPRLVPVIPLRTEIVTPRSNIVRQPSLADGYYAPNRKWVDHNIWIQGYVQPATRVALLRKMKEHPSASDGAGYIYALAIGGRNIYERFQIKIGREKEDGKRSGSHWPKHYCEFGPRHLFPGDKLSVPAYTKVERLVLLEMADLAQHKAYLDPGSIRARMPPSPRAKALKEPCMVADCNTDHIEIFSFDSDANREGLEKLVVSIVKKWSQFCIKFDSRLM